MLTAMEVWAPLSIAWLVVSLGGFAVAAYGLAMLTLRERPASVRLCAATLAWLAALVLVFFGLSIVHLFQPWSTLLLSLATAAGVLVPNARWRDVLDQATADRWSLVVAWRDLDWPSRVLLLAAAVFVVVLVLPRTFVTPPLAWDDLTYHLFKAGSWVNAGGFTGQAAPDSWSYYNYFPGSGEVVWSWFFLPDHNGALLGVGTSVVWGMLALAAYTATRLLGSSRNAAVAAALALITVPSVAVFLESGYVDNLELLAFVLGFAFLVATTRSFNWVTLFLGVLGLSLAAGVKQAALPLLALGVVWAVVLVVNEVRRRDSQLQPARAAGVFALVLLGASLVAAPWYLRSWVAEGSPVYPLELSLPGVHLQGNADLLSLTSGRPPGVPAAPQSMGDRLTALRDSEAFLRTDPLGLNWQPFPTLYIALGLFAGGYWLVRRKNVAPTLFLLGTIAFGAVQLLSPDTIVMRTHWAFFVGRLLLTALAAFVLLIGALPWRWVAAVLQLMAALQLYVTTASVTHSWGITDQHAVGVWLSSAWPFLLVAAACFAVAATSLAPKARPWLLAAGAIALVALPIDRARDDNRYAIYEGASANQAFRLHPAGAIPCSFPLWRAVDSPEAKVVAVAAGSNVFDAHNFARYPFLGSSLQNEVVYIPVTADGTVMDYSDPRLGPLVNEAAFLRRLRDENVSYLALLPPPVPESDIVKRHPEAFRLVAKGSCNDAVLYAVDTARLP